MKCKICGKDHKDWNLLDLHWQDDHPEDYAKLQAWLDSRRVVRPQTL